MRVNKEDLITETECTAYELAVGSEYQFRVSAENKAGPSKPSEPSEGVTIKPPYGKLLIWEKIQFLSKICSKSVFCEHFGQTVMSFSSKMDLFEK